MTLSPKSFKRLSKFTTGIFENQRAANFYRHFLPVEHICEAAGTENCLSPLPKAAAQLEANWLTRTKTVTGVFSFQPFAESQHRHKAENDHMNQWNNSRGPRLSKPPSACCRLFPFFLAYFQQLQGCWYIPKEKNTLVGWGRRAPTRNNRSARRPSTGEGFFQGGDVKEEGQSCKRIRFQQAVRSSQGLMLLRLSVTSDCYIMDVHPDSAAAQEVETSG